MKKIAAYGLSNYYLNEAGQVLRGISEGNAKVIYTLTPISRGYREFMPWQLYEAMDKEGLFHDNR